MVQRTSVKPVREGVQEKRGVQKGSHRGLRMAEGQPGPRAMGVSCWVQKGRRWRNPELQLRTEILDGMTTEVLRIMGEKEWKGGYELDFHPQ